MPALHPRRPALYNLWREMRYRCHRPEHKNFAYYGARAGATRLIASTTSAANIYLQKRLDISPFLIYKIRTET